jgi:hypothetical protein
MLCPGERGGLLNIGREYSPLRTELVAKEFRMEQTTESLLLFWELNVILYVHAFQAVVYSIFSTRRPFQCHRQFWTKNTQAPQVNAIFVWQFVARTLLPQVLPF